MRIAGVDLDERALVIAEIGNNHEGDLETARELVRRASEAGAGAVKFQTIVPGLLVRPSEEARLAQLSRFALSREAFRELAELAHACGMLFLSTPFDLDSAAFVGEIADAVKVASGDNDFVALLEAVAATGKPVLLSSGMADLAAIRRSVDIVRAARAAAGSEADIVVLHCVSAYPLHPADANLAAIPMLARELDCTVGYSDHTIGIDACAVAVSLGARVVEKHFTLSHDFSDFRDHQLSAEPDELAELVRRVEAAAILRGREEKSVREPPDAIRAARRSIVAAADLVRGHVLRPADLTWLRPRDGLAPGEEGLLVGRTLARDLAHGESILPADVE